MKTRTLILNGIAIGEVPDTGDVKADALATREFLETKGLWKPKPKSQQMYAVACSFHKTAAMLYERLDKRHTEPGWRGMDLVPFVVNTAFSLELFLKTIGEAHGKAPWGHDLLVIYKKLPAAARESIESASPQLAPRYSPDGAKPFHELIGPLAKSFERWRYSWELQDGAGMVNVLDAIAALYVLHDVATRSLFPGHSGPPEAGAGPLATR